MLPWLDNSSHLAQILFSTGVLILLTLVLSSTLEFLRTRAGNTLSNGALAALLLLSSGLFLYKLPSSQFGKSIQAQIESASATARTPSMSVQTLSPWTPTDSSSQAMAQLAQHEMGTRSICYTGEGIPFATLSNPFPVNWTSQKHSKFDAYFKKYSQQYFGSDTDWRWFKVQAFVESNFRPQAVSKAGAVGLMQVMPSTFEQIQRMDSFFENKSIDDAETNIAAGIFYNKHLMDRWSKRAAPHKRVQLMFASYNAGMSRVGSLVPKDLLDEDDLLRSVSKLPGETRHYLRKLSHFMHEYRGVSFLSPEHGCAEETNFNPLMMAAYAG